MNNPEIFTLFSAPVYRNQIQNFDSQSVVKLLEDLEYERTPNRDGFMSKRQNLLLTQEFSNIKEIVEGHLYFYLYDILKVDTEHKLKHACSWAIYHDKDDWCFSHLHTNSLFSGVLYIRVPEDSGNILGFSSCQAFPTWCPSTMEPKVSEYNIFNSKGWNLGVSDGTILLFPSHVMHQVPQSKANEKRRCISFNYFLTGKFGLNTTYAEF